MPRRPWTGVAVPTAYKCSCESARALKFTPMNTWKRVSYRVRSRTRALHWTTYKIIYPQTRKQTTNTKMKNRITAKRRSRILELGQTYDSRQFAVVASRRKRWRCWRMRAVKQIKNTHTIGRCFVHCFCAIDFDKHKHTHTCGKNYGRRSNTHTLKTTWRAGF